MGFHGRGGTLGLRGCGLKTPGLFDGLLTGEGTKSEGVLVPLLSEGIPNHRCGVLKNP